MTRMACAHCHIAGALIAFFFPAVVGLKALRLSQGAAEPEPRYWRGNAYALLGLGVVQVATGIAAVFIQKGSGPE